MLELITLSIGLGLVVSVFYTEFNGVGTGGLIVPGYFALFLNKPMLVIMTFLTSLATFYTVKFLSNFVIIYGRRRTMFMILTGFILGWGVRYLDPYLSFLGPIELSFGSFNLPINFNQILEFDIIGYILPGLIAIWMERQGSILTISSVLTSSSIVRLLLIILFGQGVII